MPDPVRVIVDRGLLRILAGSDSGVISGKHRIYFANVLGLEPLTTPEHGYRGLIAPSRQALIPQIADYLAHHGLPVSLEGDASAIVNQFARNSLFLEESRAAGTKMKVHRSQSGLIEVPQFVRGLKSYQVGAVDHAVQVANPANFSVPGSGKTTVALAAYSILKARELISRLVVIGPRACFMPWEEEYESCFGRAPSSTRITGGREQRTRLYREAVDAELVLLSYQMASNDVDDLIILLQQNKTLLVLDESHNVKRIEGGKWADAVLKLAPYATRRMILSGTPAPNSLLDLWTQFTFLWPNPPLLGERDSFRVSLEEQEATSTSIRNSIRPFFWRVKKSDLRLPRPTFHRIRVDMHDYQRRIYDAIASKVLKDTVKAPEDRTKLRAWRRAKLVRLVQTASNPSLLTEYSTEFRIPPLDASDLPVDQLIERYSEFETPAKLECAAKLARQLVRRGQKVLVWTTFVHNIRTLESMLRDLGPLSIFGEVPKDDEEDDEHNREQIIRQFRTTPAALVLIANPAACAESVSLHRICRHAIYLDRTFNGAQFMQSLDRIHRVGLGPRDRVHYYLLEADDSVDLIIDARLEEKRQRMLRLLEDDVPVMSLESSANDISEDGEEEKDFSAVVAQLKKEYGASRHGRKHS
jgi:SNF2 family DNA or RNA helicase